MKPHLIFTICLTFLFLSCTEENPVIPDNDKLTEHISSTHFDYYFSKNDTVKIDTAWQEKYYSWLVDTLKLQLSGRLQYMKYRDRAHLKSVTGKETNGFAELGSNTFHTIWQIDNHESVHTIVIHNIGHPPALFNEGIAVAHQADYFKFPKLIPEWNGQNLHTLAKNFLLEKKIPSLDQLLGYTSYWDHNADITYPVSGSFVRYLIDTHGLEKMKRFIKLSTFEDPKEKIRGNFRSTYGFTIEAAWSEWENFIAK